MMEILRAAKRLNLPDWWICAGFVRAKIWDTLHGYEEATNTPDVDVIYFDQTKTDESVEKELETKLRSLLPDVPWSVKNEARMHVVNDIPAYASSVDAISKFPETTTALGVKLDDKDCVVLTAPCGIEDVWNMEVRPTTFFKETRERMAIYERRIVQKKWQSIWPKVKVYHT
ncbi:nucleotidyltransferase family protein [Radiobacillus kanasensis]|uniref:nucleotidyltransferase family protein n=1 Tax=Radiobacillus kanasensis TaxID=2844358 RepID=UPI001E35E5DF|nr:nucleotidyltransferase family protein [Radiobacillus kanasensis]UFU01321.1 nucleotidyltransferase family protein [Radiobacillus kanasensis]